MESNEIIKALDMCSIEDDFDTCKDCPYKDDICCFTSIRKDTLDLINRLKVEIERLKKENHRFADIGKTYSEIKSEARKEFAERLKRRMGFCDLPNVIVRDHIDNILKEMG